VFLAEVECRRASLGQHSHSILLRLHCSCSWGGSVALDLVWGSGEVMASGHSIQSYVQSFVDGGGGGGGGSGIPSILHLDHHSHVSLIYCVRAGRGSSSDLSKQMRLLRTADEMHSKCSAAAATAAAAAAAAAYDDDDDGGGNDAAAENTAPSSTSAAGVPAQLSPTHLLLASSLQPIVTSSPKKGAKTPARSRSSPSPSASAMLRASSTSHTPRSFGHVTSTVRSPPPRMPSATPMTPAAAAMSMAALENAAAAASRAATQDDAESCLSSHEAKSCVPLEVTLLAQTHGMQKTLSQALARILSPLDASDVPAAVGAFLWGFLMVGD
jgi:hypothetical protein